MRSLDCHADASVVRECANAAQHLSEAEPHELVNLVVAHHKKITHYLCIRSLILDGVLADVPKDFDLKIF